MRKGSSEIIKIEKRETKKEVLFELAWEVCNQVGGIYTVLRSKVPAMVEKWGDDYCLIGPYIAQTASIEFEPSVDDSPFSKAAEALREQGIEAHHGHWLVTGRPRMILVDFEKAMKEADNLKFGLWEDYKISTINAEPLVNKVIVFGHLIELYLTEFVENHAKKLSVIAHFHEWMSAVPLLNLVKKKVDIATVFTTHATMLGRYIAGNVSDFYEHLPTYKWRDEAKEYGIEAQAGIEYNAAQLCHVLTTVSDITAKECEVFFERKCDLILPNGLNITRFAASHEFQNL
ncbi:MAG: glycogen(starch) synthase, partial [Arcticibacterium sp.]